LSNLESNNNIRSTCDSIAVNSLKRSNALIFSDRSLSYKMISQESEEITKSEKSYLKKAVLGKYHEPKNISGSEKYINEDIKSNKNCYLTKGRKIKHIGKIIKNSKTKYIWKINVNNIDYKIELLKSNFSKIFRILLNGE